MVHLLPRERGRYEAHGRDLERIVARDFAGESIATVKSSLVEIWSRAVGAGGLRVEMAGLKWVMAEPHVVVLPP
jgi:hypothetical protein